MCCVVAQPSMHHWLKKTVQYSVCDPYLTTINYITTSLVEEQNKNISNLPFFQHARSTTVVSLTRKGSKTICEWIFGRRKEKRNLNKPRTEMVWILKCSKTSGFDQKNTSVCVLSLFLSLERRTRIGWESEVSHTSAMAVGDRGLCRKMKLHISEYVSADACSGGRSLNPYWHV